MELTLDGSSEYGAHIVNQAFRFVKGIWLHRKSRQIRFFSLSEMTYCTSYVRNTF